LVSFEVARSLRKGGHDLTDMQLVEQFNSQLQAKNPSRPYRNQKSLMKVLLMTREVCYGEDDPLPKAAGRG
jgi:hypothetical protein